MKKREPTGRSWNRKRKIRPLMACLLAAAVVAAAAQIPNAAVKAAPVDLDQECSLKVVPSSDQGFLDDLEGEVAIDLYKVADAVKASGYDTYGYDVNATYGTLESSLTYEALSSAEMTNEKWQELAQEAAKIAFGNGDNAQEPSRQGMAEEVVNGLKPGLYLVVARDANAETGQKTVERETGKEASENGKITTRVLTKRYSYYFEPQLVSIPGKPVADGVSNTANAGDWEYDMTATLKPEQEERFGDLKITKSLQSYETQEPAQFVFQVNASRDGEIVYSDVVSVVFDQAGQQEVTLMDKIPVDAEVEVKEVYSGAAYRVSGSDTANGRLESADDMLETAFANTYDDDHRGGHGILNSFTYSETDGWQWDQAPSGQQ